MGEKSKLNNALAGSGITSTVVVSAITVAMQFLPSVDDVREFIAATNAQTLALQEHTAAIQRESECQAEANEHELEQARQDAKRRKVYSARVGSTLAIVERSEEAVDALLASCKAKVCKRLLKERREEEEE